MTHNQPCVDPVLTLCQTGAVYWPVSLCPPLRGTRARRHRVDTERNRDPVSTQGREMTPTPTRPVSAAVGEVVG